MSNVTAPPSTQHGVPPPRVTTPTAVAVDPHRAGSSLDDAARTRAGVIVALAVACANGLNVLFHFAVAHLLVPAEYSLLATLFVVLTVVSVPMLSLQAAAAREIVHRTRR